MASPQTENGYTKIANELQEAFGKTRIPGEARQMLDVILRKTYGWNKKEDKISLSQFRESTGLSSVHLIRARNKLIEMNIIVVTQKGNSAVPTYRLQKNYDKWKSLPKKVIVTQKGNSVTQKGNFPLPKKVHTKEKRKETITKKNTYPQDFLGFYDKYPRKKEKKKAFNVWIRLSNKQKTSILLAVDNYKKEMELVQREEEKIKLPATFLNRENECWVDYLPENWKEPGTLSAPKKLSRHERMFGDKNEQG